MKNKQYVSLVLLTALLLGSVSCNSSNTPSAGNDTGTTASDTTAEVVDPYPDDLPDDLRFDGETFDIFGYKGSNLYETLGKNYYYLAVDEENGDVVNDAAYKRTKEVEERFGINVVMYESDDEYGTSYNVQQAVLADDKLYDLVFPFVTEDLTGLLTENIMYDINQLEYVDLTKDYYNRDAIETYAVGDSVYLIAGTYPHPQFVSTPLLFNKEAWADYKLEDPYELVRSGQWTHDKYLSLIKDTYRDLNGNNERDGKDFFGLSTFSIVPMYLYPAYGGTTVTPTDDGFEYGYGSELAVKIVEKIVGLAENPDAFYVNEWTPFFSGNSLTCIYASGIPALRDLQFDFGILPLPKLDENQENYMSFFTGGVMYVPSNVEDPEMTGAIIEALFSTSSKYMPEALEEHYIEGKLLNSDDDIEMYRLMTSSENAVYDFTRFFDPTGGKLKNFQLISELITAKSINISSSWAALEEISKNAFDGLFEKVAGNQ
ncbi:MAG: hypothetical protein IJ493_06050 [Clostridia bacterium]|nr:hypothetical protein [Clostridia bacterium]